MKPSTRATKFAPSAIELGARSDQTRVYPQTITSVQVFNALGRSVIVGYRSGIRQTVPNSINAARQCVMVRLTYQTHPGVITDTALLLNDNGAEGSATSQILNQAIHLPNREFVNTGVGYMQTSHVDFFISLAELEQNGNSIYIDEVDIVLSLNSLEETPYHPHSLSGMRERSMPHDPARREEDFHLSIEIHDSDNVFGDRFVNVHGEVYLVRRRRDAIGRDGIYLFSNYPVMSTTGTSRQRVRYFTFEEADQKLQLYHTHREALTLGNPADVYRKQLEDLQQFNKVEEFRMKNEARERDAEFDRQKREWEREREEAKQDQLRQERRLREREHELDLQQATFRAREHELKMDALYRKEGYEVRSAARRDWYEALKYIPAVITLVATGYAAYKKYIDK